MARRRPQKMTGNPFDALVLDVDSGDDPDGSETLNRSFRYHVQFDRDQRKENGKTNVYGWPTSFGFDKVCTACSHLYWSRLVTASEEVVKNIERSICLGAVLGEDVDEACKLCTVFSEMRDPALSNSCYYLHAFSASMLIYERSVLGPEINLMINYSLNLSRRYS